MLASLLDILFGCSHKRTSFPRTPDRRSKLRGMYIVCLDCGQEFDYNWQSMKVGTPVPKPAGEPKLSPANR